MPGKFVYTPQSGTVLSVGTHTLNTTFTQTNTINYTKASASVSINVIQKTPTITWHNPAALVYGTQLSGTQLDATALVPGTFVYTPSLETELDVGLNQTLNTIFTPIDTANYTMASANIFINVKPVTPTITWSNPTSITYGAALNNTQLDATVSVP